jgi:hypothetical protein
MFWGHINDDLQNWTQEQFLKWAFSMDAKYGKDGKLTNDLYEAVGEIFKRFPVPVVSEETNSNEL